MNKKIIYLIIGLIIILIVGTVLVWHFLLSDSVPKPPDPNGKKIKIPDNLEISFSSERIYGYPDEPFFPSGFEIKIYADKSVIVKEYKLYEKEGANYEYGDGTLTAEDMESFFTKKQTMEYKTKITEEDLVELVQSFFDYSFFSLKEFYPSSERILAQYDTISIVIGDKSHSLRSYGVPADAFNLEKIIEKITKIIELATKDPIILSLEETENRLVFKIITTQDIYIPKAGLFSPPYHAGPWKIYRFEEEERMEWYGIGRGFTTKEVNVKQACIGFWCDASCDMPEVGCSPIPHPPFCEKISAGQEIIFEWDKTHIIEDEMICNGKIRKCSKYVPADAGKYKMVFSYKTDPCPTNIEYAQGREIFQNNIRSIEKVFSLGIAELRVWLIREGFIGTKKTLTENDIKEIEKDIREFFLQIDPEIEILSIPNINVANIKVPEGKIIKYMEELTSQYPEKISWIDIILPNSY